MTISEAEEYISSNVDDFSNMSFADMSFVISESDDVKIIPIEESENGTEV